MTTSDPVLVFCNRMTSLMRFRHRNGKAAGRVRRGSRHQMPAIAFLTVVSLSTIGLSAPVLSSVESAGDVGRFEKFEVTFQVTSTVAQNLQWPYDGAPPRGVEEGVGISVDALFTPDGWQTVYSQPGFLFRDFVDEIRDGKAWLYPTDRTSWKVRFAPDRTGSWQFKIRVTDASGTVVSGPRSFSVHDSPSPGFLHVSTADPRYFEFDDGSPFVGLGFQGSKLTEADFQKMKENGIQLVRVWLGPLSIFGSQWNPYYEIRNTYLGYVPRAGVLPFTDDVTGQTSIKLRIDYEPAGNSGWFDACRVIGYWGTPTEVKPHTRYRIQVTYRGFNIEGPRDPSHPAFGLVVKTDVASSDFQRSFDGGIGRTLTNHGQNAPDAWNVLEGSWDSGSRNFLPKFFMVLENVRNGQVYIDRFSMREDLGDGSLGPEIMHKPSMQHLHYFQQRNSFYLDKVVAWAEKYGVYLKLVVLEKGEKIMNKIDFNGEFAQDDEQFFYGNYREVTKVRWLQQAWWRYLQARWGYSPSIHSWELLNEGDPVNARHYALTDEFGKYMHCRVFGAPVGSGDASRCTYQHPDSHLITTSFWHSLPADRFWSNSAYPNVDYVDLHAYISTGWITDPEIETDAARYHLAYSKEARENVDYYAERNGLATKPIIRGEAGIDRLSVQQENPKLAQDRQGIWLHNLTWSQLDAGAMLELYWWGQNRETLEGPDGKPGLYEIYRTFDHFVRDVPLNNGHYHSISLHSSNDQLRVEGQQDDQAGRAHLWIQNKAHTWNKVVDGVAIAPASGNLQLDGFAADGYYRLTWFDTYSIAADPTPTRVETIQASSAGVLTIPIVSLVSDVALKISGGQPVPEGTPARPKNLRAFRP